MKIEQIQQIIEVAQVGSINRASQNLYIAQSTLSSSIKCVETELRQKLFIRTQKGIEQTEFGKIFVKYGKTILEAYQHIQSASNLQYRNGSNSAFKISIYYLLFANRLLYQMFNKYSDQNINFHYINTPRDRILFDVAHNISEIGIIAMPSLMKSQWLDLIYSYLYELVGETARLQKNMAYMSEVINEKEGIGIAAYEQGLMLQLKLYYFAYLKFTVEKNKSFSEQLISVVEDSMNLSKTAEEIDTITNSYVNLLNDISYMHGNLRDGIWKFERDELKKLFTLEARLIELNKQSPVVRPLKGVLMTQLSNFILKSRNNYNEDYICKYISEDVARESIKNHEIWMRKTQDLNDEREQKVIPELFEDSSWIKVNWAKDIDFTATRTYYVSSFSKSYDNPDMQEDYGKCVYGYKGDRLVELLAPIGIHHLKRKDNADVRLPLKTTRPFLSQVIAFDVLYDRDAAKQELNFLMDVIDKFKMSNQDKKKFLEGILQYWILSVKDSEWEKERERRYVLFIYLEYDYKEMEIDDGWLKLKTSFFLLPDFILGNNPSKIEIRRQIDGKRKGTSMKDYIFCKNCLSRDYDAIIANVNKCPICGSTNIENVYLKDEEEV